MEWLAAIASILGTSGVTAIIAAITAPRSEAKRLRAEIAANSVAAGELLSGSKQVITRAMNADGFRLASLTLVRFERWLSVTAGLFAIFVVAAAGVTLIFVGSPPGYSIERQLTSSFVTDPVGSTFVTVGVLLAGIALGWAVGFVRSSMLRSARTAFVREQLRALDGLADWADPQFGRVIAFWKAVHSRGTEILFTRD